jgi:nucleotide-binding universal stress UspA family protein
VLLCGTEGKSFVDYLFSGSVSEDLALKGEGRTMTVRYELLETADDAGRLGREFAHRLVIPTDFSSSSMRALLSAFARPAEALGTLHILHVLAEGESRADAEAHMRALTALAEEHRTDFVAEIRAGDIAPTVLGYLEEVAATGIITGRHGMSQLGRGLLGSVSMRLLQEAPCPVVIQP